MTDGALDSLYFWPPAMRYARAGDTISIRMQGLRLGRVCAEVRELRWAWNDSVDSDFYTLRTQVEKPSASCPRGGTFDSTFRVVFYTHAGEKLFIRSHGVVRADSLLYLSGEGYTETFVHRDSDPDSATIDRGEYHFIYHDSTSVRKRRFVTAVLPACETFQSSVYKREGGAIAVRVRRIVALPLAADLFPPCAGPHPDTMEVVLDAYPTSR